MVIVEAVAESSIECGDVGLSGVSGKSSAHSRGEAAMFEKKFDVACVCGAEVGFDLFVDEVPQLTSCFGLCVPQGCIVGGNRRRFG